MDPSRPHTSPEQDLDLDLASRSAGGSGVEGCVDLRAGHVLGGPSASTGTGVDEYPGNVTVDSSFLSGGGNSPGKVDDYASLPIFQFSRDRGKNDDNDEEEEDVMCLYFKM